MRILAAEQHQPAVVRIECHRMLDTRGRVNFVQLLPFAASALPGVRVHRSVEAARPDRAYVMGVPISMRTRYISVTDRAAFIAPCAPKVG